MKTPNEVLMDALTVPHSADKIAKEISRRNTKRAEVTRIQETLENEKDLKVSRLQFVNNHLAQGITKDEGGNDLEKEKTRLTAALASLEQTITHVVQQVSLNDQAIGRLNRYRLAVETIKEGLPDTLWNDPLTLSLKAK